MTVIKLIKKIVAFFRYKKGGALYYLCRDEALPKPFEPEEEQKRLYLASRGDGNAKNELIEHNLRLVVYIARKFDNTNVELDDLISIGTIGLIKAINGFDAEKNIKLATFASRCIENEILMFLRKTSKIKGEISFDEPLNVDAEGNELLLSDVLGTDADVVSGKLEKRSEKKLLYTVLNRLNGREKTLMDLRFGLNGERAMTQKEVATLLGISQSYISRLEKKIVKKLRKEFLKEERA